VAPLDRWDHSVKDFPGDGAEVASSFPAGNIIDDQVVIINLGGEHDGVLELRRPSGISVLHEVINHLLLLMDFVLLGLRKNGDNAKVLLADFYIIRLSLFDSNFESDLLGFFFGVFILITGDLLGFLCLFLFVDEHNRDDLLGLTIVKFDSFVSGQVVFELNGVLFGHLGESIVMFSKIIGVSLDHVEGFGLDHAADFTISAFSS
jgi:hypothetical protein